MRSKNRRKQSQPGPEFVPERLEPRVLLDATPLPLVTEMMNPSNTVVRFETNFGDIDIELFDTAAPITVANFLKYVRDGDYDKTFFHRLAKQDSDNDGQADDPFVIQGGLARLDPDNTAADNRPVNEIPIDAQILNEFNQSNLQRTIAMARRSTNNGQFPQNVNSATSQFFFNMANNTFLDTVDQGFTVFGRVLNDRSWMILQTIDGLTRRDIDTTTNQDAYGEVPSTADFDRADGIQEDELVVIVDAEIIKPANVAGFYTHRYYFPEGFAANNISEFIPLINPGASAVSYQIIARSEFARTQPPATPDDSPDPDFWYRDKVIATGTLAANRRVGFTVSRAQTNVGIVQRFTPYAYELWATGPLGANLSHYSADAATGESFTDTPAMEWTIVDLRKGGDNRDFVLWQNISDEPANLTITFLFQDSTPSFTFNTTTEAFRRGGFNAATFGTIPNGNFSVRITSDQLIVASKSHYNNGANPGGTVSLGIRGEGSARGVLPLSNFSTTDIDEDNPEASSEVVFLNPGSTVAIVTLIFSFSDGSPDVTVSPPQLIIQPGRRATYSLANVPSLNGRRFTVRYSSGSANLFAEVLHTERGDEFASAFHTTASTRTTFADGFLRRHRAGVNLFEDFAVYNPYSGFLGLPETDAEVTFRFVYNDGGPVITHTVTVAGGGRFELDATELTSLLDAADAGRNFFAVEIASDIPVIAMARYTDLIVNPRQPPGGFNLQGGQRNPVAFDDLDDFI